MERNRYIDVLGWRGIGVLESRGAGDRCIGGKRCWGKGALKGRCAGVGELESGVQGGWCIGGQGCQGVGVLEGKVAGV